MKKALKLGLIFSLLSIFILPFNVEAKTLAELRKELNNWEAELKKNTTKKQQTQNQISTHKGSIMNKQNQISTNQEKMSKAEEESAELSQEIKNGKDELKKLMNAYQISESNNVYLEYIFDSTSYEELVYRYAVMEQIMDYINGKIDGWNDKIDYNTELKKELSSLEVQLNKQINNLSDEIEQLGDELDKYDDARMEIKDEIESTKKSIKMYENIGCKENEDLKICLASKSSKSWTKPLTKGRISSYFGYRTSPITGKKNTFHSGTDIAGNPEGTPVYAAANGKVGKIIEKASCGGNQVYVYHTVNGKKYTTCYMHLWQINVKVGQTVTINTVVGTVGGGKKTRGWEHCSTGAHLHLGLGTGWYGVDYLSYSSWKARLLNAQKEMKLPPKGQSWSSRF